MVEGKTEETEKEARKIKELASRSRERWGWGGTNQRSHLDQGVYRLYEYKLHIEEGGRREENLFGKMNLGFYS